MITKANALYGISGLVVDQQTRQGVAGLRVEAWDRDVCYDVLVGQSTTKAEGHFNMELSESDCEEFYLDDHPHLFFKVFSEDELIEHTEHSTLWRDVKVGDNKFMILV